MRRVLSAELIEPGDLSERTPASKYPLQRRLWARISHALESSGWYCLDCEKPTERIEGEHGQPAACERCGSCRIEYHPAN